MEQITIIGGFIVSVGTFIAGLFVGRRKNRAEARSKELSNVDQEINLYKRMLDDLKGHNEELRKMNKDLIEAVQPLRDRVQHLEEAVDRLQKENEHLKTGKP